jgi:hypothetical protein
VWDTATWTVLSYLPHYCSTVRRSTWLEGGYLKSVLSPLSLFTCYNAILVPHLLFISLLHYLRTILQLPSALHASEGRKSPLPSNSHPHPQFLDVHLFSGHSVSSGSVSLPIIIALWSSSCRIATDINNDTIICILLPCQCFWRMRGGWGRTSIYSLARKKRWWCETSSTESECPSHYFKTFFLIHAMYNRWAWK